MSRGKLARFAAVGLTILCVGLGSNAILAGQRSDRTDGPSRLDVSSVDLSLGTQDAALSARNMVPGDAVTAAITVTNSSRQAMSYAMSRGVVSDGGAALSAAVILTIKTIGSSCAENDGTTLFIGPLDQAAFGSEGNGRPLPAATAEILCFRAALPFDAGNELQGTGATITLSFGATWQAAA